MAAAQPPPPGRAASSADETAFGAVPTSGPGGPAGPGGAPGNPVTGPTLSLPKSGGAVRGIGEKFAANPALGTGSMTVPIATSPGRSGFGPQLALTYDSGAGNGVFGLGWGLSTPAISRATDTGIPRYGDAEPGVDPSAGDRDADDSDAGWPDVFLLSGAENLVPAYRRDADVAWLAQHPGTALDPEGWVRAAGGAYVVHEDDVEGFRVRRYRPRTEGLFARIERWTSLTVPGDVHWRSIAPDNVLSIYGATGESRIADPEDGRRIFSWLICQTRDDRGNLAVYRYKADDATGLDLRRVSERNRGADTDPRRAANRYLKRILYGNRTPALTPLGERPVFLTPADLQARTANGDWMFEVVFDYGEHDADTPAETAPWGARHDLFSSYRSGFEIRTTRLCRRVLMFHHFTEAEGLAPGTLVRSTDFVYTSHASMAEDTEASAYTYLRSVTHAGYVRDGAGYLRRTVPPLEFDYAAPAVDDTLRTVDPAMVQNLPAGVDGTTYQWVDLHGDGTVGALTAQGEGWFYTRNLSAATPGAVTLAPTEQVTRRPDVRLGDPEVRLADLAGDGLPDVVVLSRRGSGFFEHDDDDGWKPFVPLPLALTRDANAGEVRFIDLDGDGRADILIADDDAFVWHRSLGESGYGAARRVAKLLDDERGPRLVFSDHDGGVFLADMSGDGLTDLVEVRNGSIGYWPNRGYGRFGAKITMDAAPLFDASDAFSATRLRLADLDGSGTVDVVYLHPEGARLYLNQCGNAWSPAHAVASVRAPDTAAHIDVLDLLGAGTACLVISSSLPADAGQPLRYVDLMGGRKPHLLTASVNNLGAETRLSYAPSTAFSIRDAQAGEPWITRLPFPVQVIERVETIDRIARNRFVTRYAYHHGYFDGDDREFRGFGMVEQWNTEDIGVLRAAADAGARPAGNEDPETLVPPVHLKTWFHTGAYLQGAGIEAAFAGDADRPPTSTQYWREPGSTEAQWRARLLPDTAVPAGLSTRELREGYRALKGTMLRQEVYADDAGPDADAAALARAATPYMVTERSAICRRAQPRGGNEHAVFFAHAGEELVSTYERSPHDARATHELTLEVDAFGNVLTKVVVALGRAAADPALPTASDRTAQTRPTILHTTNAFTNAVDTAGAHRIPQPSETRIVEITGLVPPGGAVRFRREDWTDAGGGLLAATAEIGHEVRPDHVTPQRRRIEHVRNRYRADDLTALLPVGALQPRAFTGESYRLALTRGILDSAFSRDGQPLLPDPGAVLGAQGGDGGGYVELDPGSGEWWVPSGRGFFSADAAHTPAQEFAFAAAHFFLPRRRRDPFGHDSVVDYDANDLLPLQTRDAVGDTTTVGLRRPDGTRDPAVRGIDYRVLQPVHLTDPNRNRVQVVFDALGQLVGRAMIGKAEEVLGDSLAGFTADLPEAEVLAQLADPLTDPHAVLGRATTRTLYDLHAYFRTRDDPDPRPAVTYTISRETYDSALAPGEKPKVQRGIEYSDGFARVIQRKVLAEPDPAAPAAARWVGSGWTIFTNTGQPVRQYEPFFTATHAFEFAVTAGVSGVVFYDPLGRVVVRLHPHGAYEKARFDAWHRTDYDENDTVAGDPRADPDVAGFAGRFLAAHPEWQTWRSQRAGGALGPAEQAAAAQTAAHADTPMTVHFDALGRPFLTVTDAGPDPAIPGTHLLQHSRVELDVEGNQLVVRDAIVEGGDLLGRIAGRFRHDMLGTVLRQTSMDAGERWALDDVTGAVIRSWTSRGHAMRNTYDVLRRPLRVFTRGLDAADPARELLTDRYVYGEQHPDAETWNLRSEQFLRLDQAGAVTAEAFDFAGNPVTATRRLARVVDAALDWTAADAALAPFDGATIPPAALEAALAPMLETDAYVSTSTYDALDRAVTLTTPHTAAMTPSVLAPVYNEAGKLERIAVRLRGAEAAGAPVWTPFVTGISYNAKGQRENIDYANGTRTSSTYDPLTFRLVSLHTVRTGAAFAGDRPQPPPPGWPGADVQNLRYTYDPIGNITRIRDDAQQTIFFRNRRVEPSADFAYDALYRLTRATGREHLGQVGGAPVPHSPTDAPRVGIEWAANDGAAVGAYEEGYLYDAVGNLLRMEHRGSDPVHPGWTRTFNHASTSLIEDGTGGTVLKHGDRLSTSTVGAGPAEVFAYDAHGNTVRAPHLGGGVGIPNLAWDEHDRLRRSDLGLRGTVWFVSGADGERVRKVWRRSDNDTEERIYFSGFEIHRRTQGAAVLERETLHIMDDRARIALVETRTRDTAGAEAGPEQLIRYQYANHLGTAGLELDAAAEIISYEEYSPYGSTVYQALRAPNAALKRYRFAGKERDEETGFCYFGARYYAPWLARWLSADPAGYVDGPNLYRFARDNPVVLTDPDGRQAAPQLDPEMVAKVGAVLTAAQRASIAWRMAPGTAGLVPAAAAPATATAAAPAAGPGTGAAVGTGLSLEAGLFGAAVVKEVALVSALYLTVQLHMMRSANIVMYGNPFGVPKTDSAFPVLRARREMRENPANDNDAYPEAFPQPVPETEEEKKLPQLRRIYVTYVKKNTTTGMIYSGRTSMVIDLSKNIPLEEWANMAVTARDANHHIEDEAPEPKDPTYTQAKLDKFAVGRAVNYSNRYKDFAYLAIRGREQQLIDGFGAKRLAETGRTEELKNYAGGAKSDTKPPVTENSIRGVGKANKMGRYFHAAAIVYFNQELHPYTGY